MRTTSSHSVLRDTGIPFKLISYNFAPKWQNQLRRPAYIQQTGSWTAIHLTCSKGGKSVEVCRQPMLRSDKAFSLLIIASYINVEVASNPTARILRSVATDLLRVNLMRTQLGVRLLFFAGILQAVKYPVISLDMTLDRRHRIQRLISSASTSLLPRKFQTRPKFDIINVSNYSRRFGYTLN